MKADLGNRCPQTPNGPGSKMLTGPPDHSPNVSVRRYCGETVTWMMLLVAG